MIEAILKTAPPLRALAAIALLVCLACDDSPTGTEGPDDQDHSTDPPIVTELQPVGAGAGTFVTIRGGRFGEERVAGTVRVSGTEAAIESWADTEIVFVMPDGFAGVRVEVGVEAGAHTVAAGSIRGWEPGVIQLTDIDTATGAGEPTWSPDGLWIYYTRRVDDQYDVFRVPAAGGAPERLTNTPEDENWPDVDFHSGFIAYGSNTTASGNLDGDYEIWVGSGNFASATPVDPFIATQPYLDRTPAWSRSVEDGVSLAYSSESETEDFVIKLYRSVGGISELTTGFNPRFDPRHGDQLMFADFEAQSLVIYRTSTAPGADRVVLSDAPETGGSGDWGVNDRIVYERTDGSRDIWVMDSDGSDQAPLIASVDPEYGPRWSPNADRVVFGSHRNGHFDIFVYNLQPR